MTIKTEVFCTLQFAGLHQWSGCNIDEVSYLSNLHRHVFHFKCYSKVSHGDRDVEFIKLKQDIGDHLDLLYYDCDYNCLNFQNMSCEMIGTDLIDSFGLSKIEVSEDGENGAIITVEED